MCRAAKPAPLRNCTLRPYLTSTYSYPANATNSSSTSSATTSWSPQQHQSNGPKELNHINTEYVKDRNAIASAPSKKTNRSNNNSGTVTSSKFNQKNAATSHEPSNGGSGVREPNGKSRRNARSYNPDHNRKSHLPFDAKNDDDGGSSTNRGSLDANENDNDDNDQKIGFASFSATKSNLSHMTWRTDGQRMAKRQSGHRKFNDDYGTNRGRNDKSVDASKDGGASAPNVAYLRSNGDIESRVTSSSSSSAMLMNNNNHLNNNNAIVDTFDAPPTAMELECVAGYDGGLPQYFMLEAYDSRTKKLRLNITSAFSDVPLFRIDLTGWSPFFALMIFLLLLVLLPLLRLFARCQFKGTRPKIMINNNHFFCNWRARPSPFDSTLDIPKMNLNSSFLSLAVALSRGVNCHWLFCCYFTWHFIFFSPSPGDFPRAIFSVRGNNKKSTSGARMRRTHN